MNKQTDILVIGSGVAGLFFALRAARSARVLVVAKEAPDESNTRYAQGGIAASFGAGDDFAQHARDTLEAGDGLCDALIVEAMTREAPAVIGELSEIGARFTRRMDGALELGLEGGHSRDRIVHAKDATGREVERALLEAARAHPNIELAPFVAVLDLTIVTGSDGSKRCAGARALCVEGEELRVQARAVALASGGAGQLYARTTNPLIATGDGVALAYRAGAAVSNLEFMQFHPTVLNDGGDAPFLISEALRGFGAVLTRRDRSPLPIPHRLGSLAPRDVVSRAVFDEMRRDGAAGAPAVYLDATALDAAALKDSFPAIYETCLARGIDITRELIPVAPAAHYLCGGVVADADGQTTVEGLYACGESACTGAHGANRLASNSLLEALVFGKRAALCASAFVRSLSSEGFFEADAPISAESSPAPQAQRPTPDAAALERIASRRERIRAIMWERVGIERSDAGLLSAVEELGKELREAENLYASFAPAPQSAELRNMALAAWLTARSALWRKESRGAHFNRDHPTKREEFARPSELSKARGEAR